MTLLDLSIPRDLARWYAVLAQLSANEGAVGIRLNAMNTLLRALPSRTKKLHDPGWSGGCSPSYSFHHIHDDVQVGVIVVVFAGSSSGTLKLSHGSSRGAAICQMQYFIASIAQGTSLLENIPSLCYCRYCTRGASSKGLCKALELV